MTIPSRLVARLAAGPLLGLILSPAALGADPERELLALELSRASAASIVPLLDGADEGQRAKIARALGRVHDPAGCDPLAGLLHDEAPAVRAAAAFALGHLEGTAEVLGTGLEAERDPAVRVALLDALGRAGDLRVLPALAHALREGPAAEAEAAALALGRLGVRGELRAPAPDLVRALLAETARVDVARRRAAAYALARTKPEGLPPELAARLAQAVERQADVAARAWLVRAAGALQEEPWQRVGAKAVADTAPGVRIALARALAGRQGPAESALVGRLLADEERSVRVAALEAAAGMPWDPAWVPTLQGMLSVRDVDLQARVLPLLAAHGALEEPDGWLNPTVDPAIRAGMLATIDEAEALVGYATRDAAAAVRTRAAERLLEIEAPPEVLFRLMEAEDPFVASMAAQGLAEAHAPGAAEAIGAQVVARNDYDGILGMLQALATAVEGKPHPPVPAPGSATCNARMRIGQLTHDPDLAMRTAAGALAGFLSLPPPGEPSPPSLPAWTAFEDLLDARVQTERGEFVIAFHPEEAPYTVWRWVQFAEAGYFDGLSFHRVVPDFVVQGGDPRGDGYGGPGFALPDEFSPLPFQTGSVGMATGGPDTAGSQWFVTLSPQPHLTGDYTELGEVVQGLDVLRRLRQGDRITGVLIERRPSTASAP
ncbi:MAG: peptidylprolyl isomerase [Pseudomonadota bacterium]